MKSCTFKAIALIVVCCAIELALLPAVVCAEAATKNAPETKKSAAKPAPNYAALFKQHWTDLVKSYREQNKKGYSEKNVVLLGDSITEGFNVPKFFPDRHVLNRGIGADIIGNALPESDKRGILRRMDESVFDCNASDVFILIGINDLGSGHKPEVIAAGYREILEQIKKRDPKLRVHIQSVLPCRGTFAKHNKNIDDINARLQKMAKEFGYDYVDLHSKMTDDKGELKKEFTPEGLHLNNSAYAVWKTEIERKMKW